MKACRVRALAVSSLLQMFVLLAGGCCCAIRADLKAPPLAVPVDARCLTDWWYRHSDRVESQIDAWEASRCQFETGPGFESAMTVGEDAYSLGERLHARGDDRAVDFWARASAWMRFALHASHAEPTRPECVARASWVRHSAEVRILANGPSYGRLDPSSHLLINGLRRPHCIDIEHVGFVWKPHDFARLMVYAPPDGAAGNEAGRGVPLIVVTGSEGLGNEFGGAGRRGSHRPRFPHRFRKLQQPEQEAPHSADVDSFVRAETPFAATAVLHFPIELFSDLESIHPPRTPLATNAGETEWLAHTDCGNAAEASFTFFNPLVDVPLADSNPLARSPAMALQFERLDSRFRPISGFLGGSNGIEQARLWFLEPYQSQKTPLIFVHGLISDPTTFIAMADAVRADPILRREYQIWAFEYPTGQIFLRSAAALREQLAHAMQSAGAAPPHVPGRPAVIVGHSMGGLVAKLQVADSEDRLWRSVAKIPLDQIVAPADERQLLRREFFFEASPHVGRVVYVATPHQGSPWASLCVGRVAARLARRSLPGRDRYEALLRDNPNALSGLSADVMPTSVDLLRPDSELLKTLSAIETEPCVKINSIVGDHCRLPRSGPSDGVVPLRSALRPESESTLIVDASHTSIQCSPDSKMELKRILHLHLCETGLPAVPHSFAWESDSQTRDEVNPTRSVDAVLQSANE